MIYNLIKENIVELYMESAVYNFYDWIVTTLIVWLTFTIIYIADQRIDTCRESSYNMTRFKRSDKTWHFYNYLNSDASFRKPLY